MSPPGCFQAQREQDQSPRGSQSKDGRIGDVHVVALSDAQQGGQDEHEDGQPVRGGLHEVVAVLLQRAKPEACPQVREQNELPERNLQVGPARE